MPYAHRDRWHGAMRDYLREMSHTTTKDTGTQYGYWIEQGGSYLNYPNPQKVTLRQMRELEYALNGSETTKAIKSGSIRQFLRWCGNKDSLRWRLNHHPRVKEDGVFLTDSEIERIRSISEVMTVEHRLLFTLGADNGLRGVDMRRLTMDNVKQLLASGKSRILGKGRNGGKFGLLKLNKDSVQVILDYLEVREALMDDTKDPFWIVKKQKKLPRPLAAEDIKKLAIELSDASGIYFRAHDLRRTFGNRLYRQGVRIETISRLMRHENPGTTFKIYIGALDHEMGEALQTIQRSCPAELIQSVVVPY